MYVIHMDFQNAFDTVPHIRLVQKLKPFSISEKELLWIKSFLEKSDQWGVTGECARASTFCLHITDLPDMVKPDVCLFANDTKIFRLIRNIEDKDILQDDLLKLQSRLGKWLLRFHPDKCRVMSLSSSARNTMASNNRNYFMMKDGDKEYLEKVEQEKDIGVVNESHLSSF